MAVLTEVTPGFFHMLGVQARFGRLLGNADEKAPAAVVSAAFWQDRLHWDPKVVGSTIKLSGKLRTVIGVLPKRVHFPRGTVVGMVENELQAATWARPTSRLSIWVICGFQRGREWL